MNNLDSQQARLTSTATTPIGGVRAALDGGAVGAANVARLIALLADDDVKLDDFSVANGADRLLGVILEDGRLVDKDVLLGVVAVDKAVAGLDVEPLNGSRHLVGDDLLRLLILLGVSLPAGGLSLSGVTIHLGLPLLFDFVALAVVVGGGLGGRDGNGLCLG